MNDLDLFASAGDGLQPEHFGIDEHGRAFVEAPALAKALQHSNSRKMLQILDDDERGVTERSTPGGPQTVNIVFEEGLWRLIFRSNLPSARSLTKRVAAILRELRETGKVGARTSPAALSNRDLALMVIAEADRADAAEAKVDAISGGIGHRPSDWREMFMVTPEREFFDHLYSHGYLIDQRGTRSSWVKGKKVYKSGPDHMKPRAPIGDLFFKLVPTGTHGEKDRTQTVVRPDKSEALRDRLVAEGLAAAPVNRKQIGEVS